MFITAKELVEQNDELLFMAAANRKRLDSDGNPYLNWKQSAICLFHWERMTCVALEIPPYQINEQSYWVLSLVLAKFRSGRWKPARLKKREREAFEQTLGALNADAAAGMREFLEWLSQIAGKPASREQIAQYFEGKPKEWLLGLGYTSPSRACMRRQLVHNARFVCWYKMGQVRSKARLGSGQ